MANPAHLSVLMQGPEAWNWWRERAPEEIVDLRGTNLAGFDLKGIKLDGPTLRGTTWPVWKWTPSACATPTSGVRTSWSCRLVGAPLSGADLRVTTSTERPLGHGPARDRPAGATQRANLAETDFLPSDLRGSNLKGACLAGRLACNGRPAVRDLHDATSPTQTHGCDCRGCLGGLRRVCGRGAQGAPTRPRAAEHFLQC